MTFPTIFDWLQTFDFLRGSPAAWILLVTAAVIALFLDWRLALFALIVQYLVASLLFFDLLSPQLALIKLFTGMFVCLILYWTARQVTDGRSQSMLTATWRPRPGNQVQIGPLMISRALAERSAAVLIALAVVVAAKWGFSLYLPGLPDNLVYINTSILLLLAVGTAGLIAGREPLPVAMSVLTFLTGFELYYAALDQSTRTLAVLAGLNFVVALTASYITQRRTPPLPASSTND